MLPAVASLTPAKTRKSDDFPAPLAPKTTTSPCVGKDIDMFFSK